MIYYPELSSLNINSFCFVNLQVQSAKIELLYRASYIGSGKEFLRSHSIRCLEIEVSLDQFIQQERTTHILILCTNNNTSIPIFFSLKCTPNIQILLHCLWIHCTVKSTLNLLSTFLPCVIYNMPLKTTCTCTIPLQS